MHVSSNCRISQAAGPLSCHCLSAVTQCARDIMTLRSTAVVAPENQESSLFVRRALLLLTQVAAMLWCYSAAHFMTFASVAFLKPLWDVLEHQLKTRRFLHNKSVGIGAVGGHCRDGKSCSRLQQLSKPAGPQVSILGASSVLPVAA
eukprot:GHUV01049720.1.p1 GENE.GHUV01049720.1~~GHUV01049720.1.p1  ORF type:complete len:147 (+),score=19.46 GHUV01049720.1:208-648(+)